MVDLCIYMYIIKHIINIYFNHKTMHLPECHYSCFLATDAVGAHTARHKQNPEINQNVVGNTSLRRRWCSYVGSNRTCCHSSCLKFLKCKLRGSSSHYQRIPVSWNKSSTKILRWSFIVHAKPFRNIWKFRLTKHTGIISKHHYLILLAEGLDSFWNVAIETTFTLLIIKEFRRLINAFVKSRVPINHHSKISNLIKNRSIKLCENLLSIEKCYLWRNTYSCQSVNTCIKRSYAKMRLTEITLCINKCKTIFSISTWNITLSICTRNTILSIRTCNTILSICTRNTILSIYVI